MVVSYSAEANHLNFPCVPNVKKNFQSATFLRAATSRNSFPCVASLDISILVSSSQWPIFIYPPYPHNFHILLLQISFMLHKSYIFTSKPCVACEYCVERILIFKNKPAGRLDLNGQIMGSLIQLKNFISIYIIETYLSSFKHSLSLHPSFVISLSSPLSLSKNLGVR